MINLRTDPISPFAVGSRTVLRDAPGYLVDPDDWDESVRDAIAAEEGITLGDDHRAIFQFMRRYYETHGISPDARFVFAFIAETKGMSKNEARQYFFGLFPYGYVKQACKIAGMKQPRSWSTG